MRRYQLDNDRKLDRAINNLVKLRRAGVGVAGDPAADGALSPSRSRWGRSNPRAVRRTARRTRPTPRSSRRPEATAWRMKTWGPAVFVPPSPWILHPSWVLNWSPRPQPSRRASRLRPGSPHRPEPPPNRRATPFRKTNCHAPPGTPDPMRMDGRMDSPLRLNSRRNPARPLSVVEVPRGTRKTSPAHRLMAMKPRETNPTPRPTAIRSCETNPAPVGGDPIAPNEPTGSRRIADWSVPALVCGLVILLVAGLSAALAGPVAGPGGRPASPRAGRSGPAAANVDSDRPGPLAYSDRGPCPELIGRSRHAPPIGPVIRPSGPARRPPDKVPGAAISAGRRGVPAGGQETGVEGPTELGVIRAGGREPAGPTQGRDCTPASLSVPFSAGRYGTIERPRAGRPAGSVPSPAWDRDAEPRVGGVAGLRIRDSGFKIENKGFKNFEID